MAEDALRKLLESLHLALTKEMLERIKSGEAAPADLNAARQLLKDNDITVGAAPKGSPIDKLRSELEGLDVGEGDSPLAH